MKPQKAKSPVGEQRHLGDQRQSRMSKNPCPTLAAISTIFGAVRGISSVDLRQEPSLKHSGKLRPPGLRQIFLPVSRSSLLISVSCTCVPREPSQAAQFPQSVQRISERIQQYTGGLPERRRHDMGHVPARTKNARSFFHRLPS